VATDSSRKNYFAVLTARLEGEDRWIPVQLGASEAVSIATEINEESSERPGSHDLITRSIEEMGATISSVDLKSGDEGVSASVRLETPDQCQTEVRARPSDALALAVRSDVTVSVEEELMLESSADFEETFEDVHPSGEVTKLRQQLSAAIGDEDYERAAELKTEIQAAKRRHEESLNLGSDLEEELEQAYRGDED
jgi:bifunctional DNase/RNase